MNEDKLVDIGLVMFAGGGMLAILGPLFLPELFMLPLMIGIVILGIGATILHEIGAKRGD